MLASTFWRKFSSNIHSHYVLLVSLLHGLPTHTQQVTERISTVVQDAAARELDPNKTPSPPPRYDSNGKRANTREVCDLTIYALLLCTTTS
jgi:Splicing factor 1 helix-hairpin domain